MNLHITRWKVEQQNASELKRRKTKKKNIEERTFRPLFQAECNFHYCFLSWTFHSLKELIVSDVTMAKAGMLLLFYPAAKSLSTPFKCKVIAWVESSTDSGKIIYLFAILFIEGGEERKKKNIKNQIKYFIKTPRIILRGTWEYLLLATPKVAGSWLFPIKMSIRVHLIMTY